MFCVKEQELFWFFSAINIIAYSVSMKKKSINLLSILQVFILFLYISEYWYATEIHCDLRVIYINSKKVHY